MKTFASAAMMLLMSLIKKIYKILFLQNKIILLIFLIMLFDQFMKYFSYMGILLPQHYFIGIGTLYIKSPPFLNPETFIVHQNSVQEWVQIILLIIYPTIMISLLYLIFLIREYYYRVAISAIFLGVTSNYLDRLYTLNTTTID